MANGHTSFATLNAVNEFSNIPSMAGQYDRIILANVVNEFPAEFVEDFRAREAYMTAMQEERNEAQYFIDVVMNSEIPHLFDNNCNSGIEVKYISAKDFAEAFEMTEDKKTYLKRYF